MKKRSFKAPKKSGKIDRGKIRSAIKSLHVVPKSGKGWVVTTTGVGRITERFSTKERAVERGKTIARQTRTGLIVHGRDGRIERVNSSVPGTISPRSANG